MCIPYLALNRHNQEYKGDRRPLQRPLLLAITRSPDCAITSAPSSWSLSLLDTNHDASYMHRPGSLDVSQSFGIHDVIVTTACAH